MIIPSEKLYRTLYFIRRCEEFIIKHYPEDEMRCPMHMSMGQEHIAVGVTSGLENNCDILSSYRSHACFLSQTMDSNSFFGELYGRVNGTSEGKGGSMHLANPEKGHIFSSGIVASTISVSVGVAFANRELNSQRTSVVFFGDGAVESGSFWESLNIACLYKLPMFFICEDNGFAVNTPLEERRGYESLVDIISAYKCLVYEDDSNDVEGLYRIVKEAKNKIQNNPQPVFMNIKCYRYLAHIGIFDDWDDNYRDKKEYEKWLERDSLKVQRKRLIQSGMHEDKIKSIENELDSQIKQSVETARNAPFAELERLTYGVFNEVT